MDGGLVVLISVGLAVSAAFLWIYLNDEKRRGSRPVEGKGDGSVAEFDFEANSAAASISS